MVKILATFVFIVLSIGIAHGQTTGFVKSGDASIYYYTFGEGSPLLVINGGPGFSSEGFMPLAKELSGYTKAILFDQRGTGKSVLAEPSRQNISMDLMIQDIESIRQELEIDQWLVLGHSFGGMLASYYAALHPNKISGLILSASGGIDLGLLDYFHIRERLSEDQNRDMDYWTERINQGDTSYNARYQRGLAIGPAYLYDLSNLEVLAKRLTQGNMDINRIVWTDLRRMNFDCSEQLRDFTSPVLIIQGEEDVIEKETAEYAARVFPESKLHFIANCGHYGWLDQPEEYYSVIHTFISSITDR